MHHVEAWLGTLPAAGVYLLVGLVIGVESMGIPLPGEIVLVSAALLAAAGVVGPGGVAVAAALGAIVGDSIGYAAGRRGGRPLLDRLGRRFPRHLGPEQIDRAERMFARWGVWAVFLGRFVALLRILAGPLAGALRVPYRRFLLANAAGGVVWAVGTTYLLYTLGRVAERWLKDVSWLALVLAVLAGLASTLWLRRRARRAAGAGSPAGRSDRDVRHVGNVGRNGNVVPPDDAIRSPATKAVVATGGGTETGGAISAGTEAGRAGGTGRSAGRAGGGGRPVRPAERLPGG
ncbi:DedA family protein [Plantactinospora sp. KBS50]|uniref:DedA family protein n=1 Tax=Plantactinospora sp. KBS50 TaxID=2024580 RepID=UPI000BAAC90E|nr:DedA family protein [Plantactinospora sp. KBS50]ASW55169.1 DedA family protein [Plantactinospora sp. KBS50]